ncbi:hypothetical protein [Brachybacterium huguangmaarense]
MSTDPASAPRDEDLEPQDEREHAEESSLESAVDDELDEDSDLDDDRVEPGADGPVGQGVEGADDILEAEREHEDPDDDLSALGGFGDVEDEFGEDDSAAAEQGNRDGDEMVSEGDDAGEVEMLDGDDADVDAIEEYDESAEERLDEQTFAGETTAGITGDVDDADPLAGESV